MSNSSSSSGIGFFGLLTILFVGLKLTGHIDWSWWWVLAPIWLGPVAFVVFLGAGVGYVFIEDAFKKLIKRLRR